MPSYRKFEFGFITAFFVVAAIISGVVLTDHKEPPFATPLLLSVLGLAVVRGFVYLIHEIQEQRKKE